MNTHRYFEDIGAWPHGSRKILRTYVIGFILSILLSLAAYLIALHDAAPRDLEIAVLIAFALCQFATQLVCFFHLSTEAASRERLAVLGAASIIVLILVSGSLWIMFTLNGRMMPDTQQMEQYMNDQSGF